MLQKKARLSGARVRYLLQKGKFFANIFFTLRFLPTKNTMSRFAVIVSTKIEKKAVKRNKLRRQSYEIIRLNQNLLTSPHDMVLRIKYDVRKLDYKDLKAQIINVFQHLNTFQK